MNDSPYHRNIPLFVAFRVLFNARWYYPIMAILFMDLGLSVGQYAMLNVAWAAAIVGLEVPSGAMADHFGRRKMIIFASALMVIEMAVFAFAPRGQPTLLFTLFLINRVFSGAAEASASGADEALAYDSLAADGRKSEWPQVLERVMRWQSAAFFVTMMLGAALYDPEFIRAIASSLGIPSDISPETARKLPIFLTLGNALIVFFLSFKFREPPQSDDDSPEPGSPWKATLATARWIWASPLVVSLIVCGLCFDSIVRLFLTFESSYFRVIHLPTALFGVLAAALALLGFVVPAIAKRMVAKFPMRTNFTLLALLIFFGLAGAAFVTPWYGLIWVVPLGLAMGFVQFFVSHYLNELVVDSRKRATVLSFRGLAFNLAYGGVGLLFAGLTALLARAEGRPPADAVFADALGWLPWYFLASVALMLIVVRWRRGKPASVTN